MSKYSIKINLGKGIGVLNPKVTVNKTKTEVSKMVRSNFRKGAIKSLKIIQLD